MFAKQCIMLSWAQILFDRCAFRVTHLMPVASPVPCPMSSHGDSVTKPSARHALIARVILRVVWDAWCDSFLMTLQLIELRASRWLQASTSQWIRV